MHLRNEHGPDLRHRCPGCVSTQSPARKLFFFFFKRLFPFFPPQSSGMACKCHYQQKHLFLRGTAAAARLLVSLHVGFSCSMPKTFCCVLCCCLQKWKCRRGAWKVLLVLILFFLAYRLVPRYFWLLGKGGSDQILQISQSLIFRDSVILNTLDALLIKIWLERSLP